MRMRDAALIAHPGRLHEFIHEVRGHKVMLDKDLARLYGVKPIRLREQVIGRVHSVDALIQTVSEAISHAKAHVSTSVNSTMTWLYWGIGRHIVLFERGGKRRAVYGQELLKTMARRLMAKHGRGYSWRSLYLMVEF